MAILPRQSLYSFFETGDIPTQEQFADLIDSYIHREEDGVFIYKPTDTIKRFGIGLNQPPYRLGIAAEGEIQNLISLHDVDGIHKWSLNLDPLVSDLKGFNLAQETVGGSESRLFINQDSGNIGLGSLNPDQKLQIEASSPTNIVGLKMLNNATVANNGWSIGHLQEEEDLRDGGLSFNSIVDNSIERLFINPSGHVGINEPLPQTKLHVSLPLEDPNSVIGLTEDSGVVNIGPITQSIVFDSQGLQARQGEYIGETLNLEVAALNLQRMGGDILIHGDNSIENNQKVIITNEGYIGVGSLNPNERITIDGAIQLSNTENLNEGTIRWTGIDFEGYNGELWESLTGKTNSLKGKDYLFVNGNKQPLENGEELSLAIQNANNLAIQYNTKQLFIDEINTGSYFYFENDYEGHGGTIVSIDLNQIVLEGDLTVNSINIPFQIMRFEVMVGKYSFIRIETNEYFPTINNIFYDATNDQTILSLYTPFNESYNYMASSSEAIKVKVVVAPGRYMLTETLVLSNDNVDLVSLTGNTDVELDLTNNNFYTGEVDLRDVGGSLFEVVNDPFVINDLQELHLNLNFALSIEASCFVKGIRTKNHYSRTFEELLKGFMDRDMLSSFSGLRPSGFSSNYPLPIDVKPTTDSIRISPTVESCHGGNFSFGVNLFDNEYKVIDGIYMNNYALLGSFGGRCEIWGVYDNNYGEYSFAFEGIANGYFRNNIGQGRCFGGQAWGTFMDCNAGEKSFGGDAAGGTFTRCTGGQDSFGAETLTGYLYYCRLTSGNFNTVSYQGRTVYCIDGENNPNNQ